MNLRIQELAEQAEAYAQSEYDKWIPTPNFSGIPHIRSIFNEKFAELIVRECAELIDNKVMIQTYDAFFVAKYDTKAQCAKQILEHFGIEEPQGWVCPKCGTDRTKAACPRGHTAALTGDCPMYGVAQ